MKYYNLYMERQTISAQAHERLLALGGQQQGARARPKPRAGRRVGRWAALAACCALVLGLGIWRAAAPEQPAGEAVQDAVYPGIKDT